MKLLIVQRGHDDGYDNLAGVLLSKDWDLERVKTVLRGRRPDLIDEHGFMKIQCPWDTAQAIAEICGGMVIPFETLEM